MSEDPRHITRAADNTYICTGCGRLFPHHNEDMDAYDTLGSDRGICCPDCGNEEFTRIADLQAAVGARDEALNELGKVLKTKDFAFGQLVKSLNKADAQFEQYRCPWIPVSERLPGPDDIVDVIVKITTLSKKINRVRIPGIRWCMTHTYPNSHVFTHWMLSPQFPEDK